MIANQYPTMVNLDSKKHQKLRSTFDKSVTPSQTGFHSCLALRKIESLVTNPPGSIGIKFLNAIFNYKPELTRVFAMSMTPILV
jgi:hypothetical protein